MSANAPWSVKGIDAKAREVAKDLARRSGMTLGEWLNQMILEGEDVGALISRERAQMERPAAAPVRAARRAPEPDIYDEDEEAYEERPRVRRVPAYREVGYNELSDTGGRMARNDPPKSRPAAPYSTAARQPSDLRRKSIFDDRPRYDDGYIAEEAQYQAASSDLNRVARALESLGARMETSEARSATAVRGVSSAVETVLSRLERSEAAHAETKGRIDEQSQEVQWSFERLARTEEDHGLFAERLEQAERLIDAQAERLEGLSGHVREARERAAKVEEQLKSPQAQETVRAVEGALGKLANQLYEGEARTRDTLQDVRQDMVGLSHRMAQVELRDPDRAAQALIDKVVAQLAHRLEAAEAQTNGAIKTLEQAFKSLDGRVNRVEEGGDVTDPESIRSLTGLAADLSRRVEESRQDLFSALQTGKQETIELAVKVVGERIEQSEQRSAGAIEKLGQDVLRVADNLNRRVAGVETNSHEQLTRVSRDVQRVADSIDGRLSRTENTHAQALERLGGEIARISERLGTKVTESERRTAQVLGAVSEQFEQQREHVRGELADRIRQSEERTAKLLEETRARIDSRLAHVQTQSLLQESVLKPTARTVPERAPDAPLPNPFAAAPQAEPEIDAFDPEPLDVPAAHEKPLDLTGQLLGGITDFGNSDFKPDFDPFEEDDIEADFVTAPKTAAPVKAAQPVFAHDDDDDSDPFADIEVSRKTAPRVAPVSEGSAGAAAAFAETRHQASISEDLPRVHNLFDDEDDIVPDATAVSVSTRDALAAARAAVRASIEGAEERGLGLLKSGPSRARGVKPDAAAKAKGGNTFMNAVKASSIAMGVVAVGAAGLVAVDRLDNARKAETPIIASALNVEAPDTQNQQNLKTRYDLALQSLTAKDPKAVDTLKMVANQGYAPAQYKLGLIYKGDEGKLAPVDKAQARTWIKRAAEGGVPNAMFMLGSMYYNGEGGEQDRSTAAMWFRKSAERGVVDGQFNLGSLYQSGEGVPLNPTEAYKWMRIAADNGDTGAKEAVEGLAQQLSEAQRAKADDAVARFTPISDEAPPIATPGSESNS
jgi:localization factor PodJL